MTHLPPIPLCGVTLALTLLALAPSPTEACEEEAFSLLTGDLYPLTGTDQIELVREDLHLTLREDGYLVKTTYLLHNEGPSATVTLVLPQHSNGEAINDLTTTIDGRSASTPFAFTQDPIENEYDWIPANQGHWSKPLPFAEEQTREVTISYTALYSHEGPGGLRARYQLSHAAAWAGDVSAFECTLDLSELPHSWHVAAHGYTDDYPRFVEYNDEYPVTVSDLPWQRVSDSEWIWRGDTLEPEQELVISLAQGFWNFTLNGQPVTFDALLKTRGASGLVDLNKGEVLVHPYNINRYPWPSGLVTTAEDSEDHGGYLEDDGLTLTTPEGRSLVLPHGSVEREVYVEVEDYRYTERYIYLRDLIETQGGTYSYDPIANRVDLTLPVGEEGC